MNLFGRVNFTDLTGENIFNRLITFSAVYTTENETFLQFYQIDSICLANIYIYNEG